MSKLENHFPWYNVIEIGLEGIEVLVSSQDKQSIIKKFEILERRVNINNYGNTKIYMWQSGEKTSIKLLKEHPEYLSAIRITSHIDYL